MRKDYIDILKGICILAITFLHYEKGVIPPELNAWIGSFMITAFYFSSGWLFGISGKKLSVKELFNKRIRSLGLPYLWFTLIILLFDVLLVALKFKEPKFLLVELYKTITLRGIGTLWFLPALFGGELIFTYLRDKNKYVIILALLSALSYSWFYEQWSLLYGHNGEFYRIIDAPFRTLHNISIAFIVICLSYFICIKYYSSINQLGKWKLTLFAFCASILSFLVVVKIATSSFQMISFFAWRIEAILGPFAILLLCMLAEKWVISKFFVFWGKNSLILMVTHYSILMEISMILNTYFTGSNEFTGMNTIYFFLATVIVEYPIVYLINAKAKFLLGK